MFVEAHKRRDAAMMYDVFRLAHRNGERALRKSARTEVELIVAALERSIDRATQRSLVVWEHRKMVRLSSRRNQITNDYLNPMLEVERIEQAQYDADFAAYYEQRRREECARAGA